MTLLFAILAAAIPTVIYGIPDFGGNLTRADLTRFSPYNTYVHKGLPPGPVASPGVASLVAAANPANVPYLYFVASRDGHHEFRMTLEQHTNAVRQVRATKPTKKTQPRMLAMAPATKSSSRSASLSSKAPARTTAKATSTAAKAPAKTVSKATAAKTSVKTPAKSTSKKAPSRSTQTKKTTPAVTSASR